MKYNKKVRRRMMGMLTMFKKESQIIKFNYHKILNSGLKKAVLNPDILNEIDNLDFRPTDFKTLKRISYTGKPMRFKK